MRDDHDTAPQAMRPALSVTQTDDLGEALGVQAGPADRGTVDVRLSDEFGDVGRGGRPAVLL